LTFLPFVHTEVVTRATWPTSGGPGFCRARAVAVAAFGDVPVVVAVVCVAVLAEPRVVVEPDRVDLGEAQGRPECLGDLAGVASDPRRHRRPRSSAMTVAVAEMPHRTLPHYARSVSDPGPWPPGIPPGWS